MKEIKTEVFIKADIETVWRIFLDFQNYQNWNPCIQKIEGEIIEGKHIKISEPNKKLRHRAKVISYNEQRELRWYKKFFLPGLFDRERIFKFKSFDGNKTIFIHYEIVSGFLYPFLWKKYSAKTKEKFILMNRSLRKIAESPSQADAGQKAA